MMYCQFIYLTAFESCHFLMLLLSFLGTFVGTYVCIGTYTDFSNTIFTIVHNIRWKKEKSFSTGYHKIYHNVNNGTVQVLRVQLLTNELYGTNTIFKNEKYRFLRRTIESPD